MTDLVNSMRGGPDAGGHFGAYGGRFVAETLMPLVLALEDAWLAAKKDPAFQAELDDLLTHYAGYSGENTASSTICRCWRSWYPDERQRP